MESTLILFVESRISSQVEFNPARLAGLLFVEKFSERYFSSVNVDLSAQETDKNKFPDLYSRWNFAQNITNFSHHTRLNVIEGKFYGANILLDETP